MTSSNGANTRSVLLRRLLLSLLGVAGVLGLLLVVMQFTLPDWPPLVLAAGLSGDGKVLVIGSHQGQLACKDLDSGEEWNGTTGGKDLIRRIDVNEGGDRILTFAVPSSEFHILVLVDVEARENFIPHRKHISTSGNFSPFQGFFDPEGNWVWIDNPRLTDVFSRPGTKGVIYLDEHEMALKRTDDPQIVRKLAMPDGELKPVIGQNVLSPDKSAVAAIAGESLFLWRAPEWTLSEVSIERPSNGGVMDMRFTRGTQQVLIISYEAWAEVYSVDDGGPPIWSQNIPTTRSSLDICDIDSTGTRFIAASRYGQSVEVWKRRGDEYVQEMTVNVNEMPGIKPWSSWRQVVDAVRSGYGAP